MHKTSSRRIKNYYLKKNIFVLNHFGHFTSHKFIQIDTYDPNIIYYMFL
jgi:hypothetical protein